MTRPLLTYADVFERVKNFMEAYAGHGNLSACRQAILEAYQDISCAHRWSFLTRNGRVVVNARQTTGTVVYENTNRTLTLTDSTWPSWAIDGTVRFGSPEVVCDIESVDSTTVVTLNSTMNYGRDEASSSYSLYQRWVRLPEDFHCFTGPFAESSWQLGQPISMSEMLALDRYSTSYGPILYYTVAEVPDLYDRKALLFYPQPDTTETIDFIYDRRPRELRYSGQESSEYIGTVTTESGSATVTGSGTAFTDDMVGSIIRISGDSTNLPTGRAGEHPYAEERSILSVVSATEVTLDAVASATRAGVRYRVTDPIDLGWVAHNAFLRACEANLAIIRNFGKDEKLGLTDRVLGRAQKALLEAMGADSSERYDPVQSQPYPRLSEKPIVIDD